MYTVGPRGRVQKGMGVAVRELLSHRLNAHIFYNVPKESPMDKCLAITAALRFRGILKTDNPCIKHTCGCHGYLGGSKICVKIRASPPVALKYQIAIV